MPKNKRAAFALTSAYIEALHDEAVSLMWPGVEPVARGEYRDSRLISSAAARPFQTAGGVEIYDTIAKKAAALFHSLIANHPFHNGNKRTAVLAVQLFLLANNYLLALTPDEMYALAKNTATYRERGLTHDQILAQILRKIEAGAVPFKFLKQQRAFKDLYRSAFSAHRRVRQDERNRKQIDP